MRDREEHLAWCKERALEYWRMGDLENAVASMGSDLSKHEETKGLANPYLMMIGMTHVVDKDQIAVHHWIEGFR